MHSKTRERLDMLDLPRHQSKAVILDSRRDTEAMHTARARNAPASARLRPPARDLHFGCSQAWTSSHALASCGRQRARWLVRRQ